jgi:DNA-binding transcriptional LysR family regulator
MLNPQWLKTFVTLTQLGNFTRTADQLGLTQAAVSQHVRQLESQLGQLLIRRPRQLELTPAGRSLLAYCAEVSQADLRLKASLSQAHADGGEVSLITPGSIGLYLYPRLLDFQVAHPGFTIRHRFAPDTEVLEAVLQDRYELGLVTLKPDDDRLAATVFTEQALELVAPAGRRLHVWQDLQQLGFIDHPDGRAMASRLLSRVFPGAGRIQDIVCHGFINQIGLILEPVARGLGFTVMPRYARQAFSRQEAITVINVEAQVVDRLWLIHRSEWPLSQRAQRVLEHLRGSCAPA